LVLVSIHVGCQVLGTEQREQHSDADLTPEPVVIAFGEAGLGIRGVRRMNEYPAPMPPGNYGIMFFEETEEEIIHTYVVSYSSSSEARRVASSINDFNRAMDEKYGYGLSRGSVAVLVGTYCEEVAREYSALLDAIEQ
jgi:hypothetical protein